MIAKYFKGPVVLIGRLILGVVFIYASIDKIVNPGDFAKIVGNYHVCLLDQRMLWQYSSLGLSFLQALAL